MRVDVIIPAAGSGTRFGQKKQWICFRGKPLVLFTVLRFLDYEFVDKILVGVREEDYNYAIDVFGEVLSEEKEIIVYIGGKERRDTVYRGLLLASSEIVVVHDGVRPLFRKSIIYEMLENLKDCDGVIPVLPIYDTVKLIENDCVCKTLRRENLVRVQTPQVFRRDRLMTAYLNVDEGGYYPDDASILEAMGAKIKIVKGDLFNVKVTTVEDLYMLFGRDVRVGFGYDIHPTGEGSVLKLGGVEIPSEFALIGHSDGDVVIHAVIDALLGAASLGDIGDWFPGTEEYKGADSRSLLRTVYNKLKDKWYVINLDVVIVLERPKLGYYKDKIRRNLADLLEVEETLVSVKAKTKEGFDAVGNMRAVEAYAVIAIGRKVEHV